MFLYEPGELEGGPCWAMDPVWSLNVYRLDRSVTKPGEPVLYYLHDGPARGFICVIEAVTRHVLVNIFCFDLEEEALRVGVEELVTVPILPLELVVVEVVH